MTIFERLFLKNLNFWRLLQKHLKITNSLRNKLIFHLFRIFWTKEVLCYLYQSFCLNFDNILALTFQQKLKNRQKHHFRLQYDITHISNPIMINPLTILTILMTILAILQSIWPAWHSWWPFWSSWYLSWKSLNNS